MKNTLLGFVLVRASFAVKRHHGHDNSYKGKRLFGVAHVELRDAVHYHHGREDVVFRQTWQLHLGHKATGNGLSVTLRKKL